MSPRTYEEELTAYERSSRGAAEDDHDVTLGTPTIVGLFFLLTLVCGCFFGLGYAMGHRTAPATPQVFGDATAAPNGAAKPTAGSAAVPDAATAADSATATPDASAAAATQTATVPLNAPAAPPAAASSVAAGPVASATSPAKPAAASPAPQPVAATAAGNFVVQVAAVSSQDVASILLSTLQKKGYAVTARHEPQDQLLHIQIGPFADRKDADAMRQRVLADGFNAIVK